MPPAVPAGHCASPLPVPPVAQLQPFQADDVPAPVRRDVDPAHVTAIRRARAFVAARSPQPARPVGLSTILDLAEACGLAYSACERPTRSDLLVAHVDALIVAMEHLDRSGSGFRGRLDLLASLGLHAPYAVDVLESVHVLRSHIASSGRFSTPHRGLQVATTLRDILSQVPRSDSAALQCALLPHLSSLVRVAASRLYKPGQGYVAPGVGPPNCRAASAFSRSGVTLAVSSAPSFAAFLTFPGGPSLSLDLDALRTLLALFIGDPTVTGQSYRAGSLSRVMGKRPAMLRLCGVFAVPVSQSLFLALQSVCSQLLDDSDFASWTEFRADLFGDV